MSRDKRMEELESMLEQLRLGRRLLLNVLETLQHEQKERIEKLEQENERLRRKNIRLLRMLQKEKWGRL